MITRADDFPVHQTPEPIAFSGTDRNFYDRYFFNGYNHTASIFFAAAFGVYPQLGIIDAAFCVSFEGKQHNIRASRHSSGERMILKCGPIEIQIVEPLATIRIIVTGNESGITADITFAARHAPVEEPRFIRRNGTRLFMDYTRLTQNGAWSGEIMLGGDRITLESGTCWGTRDRSWGIRPVGNPESQPPAGGNLAQFFWIWAPCNFDDYVCFAHSNDDAHGLPWNRRAVLSKIGADADEFDQPVFTLVYKSGSRRIASARCAIGHDVSVEYEMTGFKFYMSGLGYTHPVWGHGMDRGELCTAYDVIDLATVDDNAPANIHVQNFCTATLNTGERASAGWGVFEQLLLGPHAPSGFNDLLDVAQ
jgi:hypothetical protein